MDTTNPINSSEDTTQVYAALVGAQRNAPEALGKQDYNSFAKFDYVSADRMIMAGRKALAEAGLALVPVSQELGPGIGESAGRLHTVYRLVHESGQWVDIVYETAVCTKKGTPEDKAGFGAATESLGYMYRGLLSIGRLDQGEVPDVTGRDDRDYDPRDDRDRGRDDRRDERRDERREPSQSVASGSNDAEQLADEYIDHIQRLAAQEATPATLQELESLPPAIKGLSLPPATVKRIVDAYNPVVIALREKLGVAA